MGGYCGPELDPTTRIDAVDNCNGAEHPVGPFSRVFGDSSGARGGPFDPLVLSTLLSDGNG